MLTENLVMPKIPSWVFIILAALYFTAARVDVMDVDASQYAEMSREMSVSNDFLHLYDKGKDYLDKPPFLFWASSLSMKVFGVNNFGYKFPSILFALLALYGVYRLTRLLYGEQTGRMAALILGCCQGMFLMTNDVRTDTILMAWTIVAIWLIKEWEISKKLKYLVAGSACIAFGLMTKGPVALMVPVFCFASDWFFKRQWKNFFQPAYLLAIVVIGILLIPMCIGLYQQFDMHPEKLIDGKTGTSGIRFFFWTQSFGRITGENTWDNGAPFSFLFENMLWAFLPWIILFVLALIVKTVELVRQKFHLRPQQEFLSTGGFVLTYLSLASSHYQLPHYIFVAFPLAAIMVAALLKDFFEGRYRAIYKVMKPVQLVIGALLLIGALATFVFVFHASWTWFVWIPGVATWLYVLLKKNVQGKILWSGAIAIIVANIFMTNHFYYNLLGYQAGSKIGRTIYQQNIPASKLKIVDCSDPLDAMHFYAQRAIKRVDTLPAVQHGDYWVTTRDCIMDAQQKGFGVDTVQEVDYYKVSELTPEFLNPDTRAKALKKCYLVRVQ